MKVSNLAHVFLSLFLTLLLIHGEAYVVSSSMSTSLIVNSASTSYHAPAASSGSETTDQSDNMSSTASGSSDLEMGSTLSPSVAVMTMTWLNTITQTSFVPVSTLVTQSGSIIYYSTWLVPIYPVTIVTSIEYITSTMKTVTETTISTVSPFTTPSIVYECICPAPETETVYLLATIGPAMAISSAILLPWYSTLYGPQTVTETISVTTTSMLPYAVSKTSLATSTSIFLAPGPAIIPTPTISSLIAK